MFLSSLEWLFGWTYFFAWSATFWPQVLLIFRRKTTAGLSTDFVTINIVGFLSYSIFTFSSFFSKSVEESYKIATGYPPQVSLADVLFAFHGAVMCSVLIAQLFIYPPRTPPKRYVWVPSLFVQLVVLGYLPFAMAGNVDWYAYLTSAGMVKVGASVVKHFPQVWLNRKRKSTVGWSYTMVLLDVVGGGFSILQQAVRCVILRSWAPFTSNPAKTFLALESLLFDFYFIAQHAFWYTDRTDIDKLATSDRDLEADGERRALTVETEQATAPVLH